LKGGQKWPLFAFDAALRRSLGLHIASLQIPVKVPEVFEYTAPNRVT
jgi:hypothetical protein